MSRLRTRTGMVAKKLGMTTIFDEDGSALPVTLLEVAENYIASNKTAANDGYNATVVAYNERSPKKARKNTHKVATKAGGVKFFAELSEFRLNSEFLPEQGRQLSVNHFVEGQLVDVTGMSIGKGFAGSMKRHNFRGLQATHGVSISHRSHGSTGQCQDPGRVFKGKKMAGHMGASKVTVHNLEIMKIDANLNVIALLGAVPGAKNSYIYINDAVKSYVPESVPYPTAYADGVSEEANTAEVNSRDRDDINSAKDDVVNNEIKDQ